jgi:hypothetical protein
MMQDTHQGIDGQGAGGGQAHRSPHHGRRSARCRRHVPHRPALPAFGTHMALHVTSASTVLSDVFFLASQTWLLGVQMGFSPCLMTIFLEFSSLFAEKHEAFLGRVPSHDDLFFLVLCVSPVDSDMRPSTPCSCMQQLDCTVRLECILQCAKTFNTSSYRIMHVTACGGMPEPPHSSCCKSMYMHVCENGSVRCELVCT